MSKDRTYIFGDDDSPSSLYYDEDKFVLRVRIPSEEDLEIASRNFRDRHLSDMDFRYIPKDMIFQSEDLKTGDKKQVRISALGEWIEL